mgnify:CR=1 FL=1
MLELFDESVAPHYMMGRKPGMFPSFSDAYAEGEGYPHPVPFDLFDPFGKAEALSLGDDRVANLVLETGIGVNDVPACH